MDDENNEFIDLENAIRERIRQARKDRKINQETMGKMLGISKTSYSEIESGKTSLPLSRFLHIVKILELDDIFKPQQEEESSNTLIEINDFHDFLKKFIAQNQKIDTLTEDVQEIKSLLKLLVNQQSKP